ncbi:hypothetical protein Hanom_Chr04g00364351 [Helianthus anomalus]
MLTSYTSFYIINKFDSFLGSLKCKNGNLDEIQMKKVKKMMLGTLGKNIYMHFMYLFVNFVLLIIIDLLFNVLHTDLFFLIFNIQLWSLESCTS